MYGHSPFGELVEVVVGLPYLTPLTYHLQFCCREFAFSSSSLNHRQAAKPCGFSICTCLFELEVVWMSGIMNGASESRGCI